jgi:hypothetical protein
MSGDGCGTNFRSFTNIGERTYRVYFEESCSSVFSLDDLNVQFTLNVPAGVNYNMYIYNNSCGLLTASTNSGLGQSEVRTIQWNDNLFTDDSKYLRVEIRFNNGASCSPWQLQIQTYGTTGNPTPGDDTESTFKVIETETGSEN